MNIWDVGSWWVESGVRKNRKTERHVFYVDQAGSFQRALVDLVECVSR